MLIHFFKIAVRNILKHKTFSAINLGGISVGIAASVLILCFVLYETSFDRFHENADRIYRVEVSTYRSGVLEGESALTSPAVGASLVEVFPEVEARTSIATNPGKTIIISNNESYREEKAYIVDPSLLEVFNFELVQGNPDKVLAAPYNIAISEKLSARLFGEHWKAKDLLNKTLELRSEGLAGTFKIAGVFKDFPQNAHFNPQILAPKSYLTQLVGEGASDNSWDFNFFYTYIRLAPKANPQVLAEKFNDYVATSRREVLQPAHLKLDFKLQPIADIHLKSQIQFELESNGDLRTVYALGLIGIVILIVAWINFINLSTARSISRAKEVGVRKVLGAAQYQLVGQFLTEAILINAVSLVVAFMMVQALKPLYSEISGVPLDFIAWKVLGTNLPLAIGAALFMLFGIVLSGLYPAFVLSGFNPVKALKANHIKPRGINIRKALVVVQFAVSLIMISATYVIYSQLSYMRVSDLGIDIERTVVIEAPENYDQTASGAASAFKTTAKALTFVDGVSMSSVVPGQELTFRSYNLESEKTEKRINSGITGIDAGFLEDYDISMAAGKTFSSADQGGEEVIINEEAARQLGFSAPADAIGTKVIHSGKQKEELTVVGVVKNYHQRSLKSAIEPQMFLHNRDLQYYSVKLKMHGWEEIESSLQVLAAQFQNHFPGNPFNYHFLDQQFDSQYKSELKFSKVFLIFSIVAVIVSGLGLIGLSTFMINLRNKEIGIRKVFGASNRSVTLLLLKDYFKLLAVSIICGIPVVWYFSNEWLASYSYRIALNPFTIGIPVLILTLTLIMTIGLQSVHAATRNPIDRIRNE